MSKFKKGDKVRIVSEIPKDQEGISFVEDMGRDLGKELTIDEIDQKGNYWLKGNRWGWHEKWLVSIEDSPKVKSLEGVKIGDSIYHEGGNKYYVYNIIPGEGLPIRIVEIGGNMSYKITIDGGFREHSNAQFFLEKPKVKKYYQVWYNLCKSVNGKVYLDAFYTEDEALNHKMRVGKILRHAVELTIEYEE